MCAFCDDPTLTYSDDRDRWPWQRAFRERRGVQPVLGERAAR